MTRINTNVSSLVAQKTLARSQVQLQDALTRLSTGLRINSGKDDPAGLIASEALRSDITATEKAISNSQRANQMIATADSALGQVGSLLNDIRGLITEAANKGAMSDDQIAANQVQVDSSLDALNRISQVTSFQGRRLLDGSLDFVTQGVSGMASVSDLQIDQATIPSGGLSVNVDITTAAAQAQITNTGFTAGAAATTTLSFASGATLANGAGDESIDLTSTSLTAGSGVLVTFVADGTQNHGVVTASYSGNTLTLAIGNQDNDTGATAAQVVAAINTTTGVKEYFQAVATDSTGSGWLPGSGGTTKPPNQTTGADTLDLTATTEGAGYNHVAVSMKVASGLTGPVIDYNSNANTLTITVDDNSVTSLASIVTALSNYKPDGTNTVFTGTAHTAGDQRGGVYGGAGADINAAANTGTSGGNVLKDALTFQLSGTEGSQVYTFKGGSSINQIVNAVNAQADATGVSASMTIASGATPAGTLNITSTAYGSDAFAAVDVISEGPLGAFKNGLSKVRDQGDDISASVNGIDANGKGNTLSINTASLSLSATVTVGSSTAFTFNITGGGSVFQLGPDVNTNQQARMGITSVNTAKLGGASGRLYELGSGGAAALATDPNKAASIVDEVLTKVSLLRGRLGAFQKTTVDTNIKTLTDTMDNLTAAKSSIEDADFAAESANLTRAQILVQAGTSVLQVANQSPQNVLALLR